MPDSFTVETREGFRRVEFDPDVFRFRDVRILVDGRRVAEMPYPKEDAPVHQATFELDGHELVAVSYLTADEPTPDTPLGVRNDLFAAGRSLSDGSTLASVRDLAARPGMAGQPGGAYPGAFKVVDMVLGALSTIGLSSFGVAIGRTAGQLGLVRTIVGAVVVIAAFGIGSVAAARAWKHIKADQAASVRRRTALGLGAIVGIFAGVLTVLAVLILVIRPPAPSGF